MLDEQFLVHVFSNIGVPAALCFYTLFEVNKNIKLLTDAFNRIEKRIERLEDRILPRHESP